jgi:hypothetical protein
LLFSAQLREETGFCTATTDRGRKGPYKGKKSEKFVPSSKPGEVGSFSSEIRHNRRKTSEAMLLTSGRRLQKQSSQLLETGLGSIPYEELSCGSEIEHSK